MKRDWPEFWRYGFISLKYVLISILLVPIFFFLMNLNFSEPNYLGELWFSTRIGIQIALFYWVCSTIIYIFAFQRGPDLVVTLKKSLKFQALKGISIMLVGLGLTSLIEPSISGRTFGLQSIAIGALVGGITFFLSILFVAYLQTKEYNLKLKAESAVGNLNVLKNQMQPHFLFNSLNSLSELIDSNKDHASAMAQKLSDLYREILENSRHQLCSLESELSIIENYLALEKLRFGERLSYKINSKNRNDSIFLPSLVLQTLVENSVKHRVSNSISGGSVEVNVTPAGSGFEINIIDRGPISSIVRPKKIGMGIENTKTRLGLIYGEKHNFDLKIGEDSSELKFWVTGRNEIH